MTNYDAGRRFEWAVRDDLRADGYEVIRSAGSKSRVDLVAIKQGQILFVQCKRDGKIGPAERSELLRIARLVDAFPVLAYHAPMAGLSYRELTGVGPRDWVEWTADTVA